MSSPSEIWLEPEDHEMDPDMGRSWCIHPLDCDECGAKSVRYVRADIAEARVKELEAINLGLTKTLVEMEAENAELRKDVEGEGI